AYRGADRPKDAIALYESVLADRGRVQGPDHPDTLTARANLAYAHRTAGRLKQAMPIYERVLADRERVQGPDHPDTLTARGNLAHASPSARRPKGRIAPPPTTPADGCRTRSRSMSAPSPTWSGSRGPTIPILWARAATSATPITQPGG